MNKIIKDIHSKKAIGPDKIPTEIIKLSTNITDLHFTNIINKDNRFSKNVKIVSVRPIFKLKKVESYRPVGILNCFSKIVKKYILE